MMKMTDQRFRPDDRLRSRADFDRVFASDAFAADAVLVVQGCKNELTYSRLGLSVSRKVGGAVIRNRWKRIIREAFRLNRAGMATGIDLVVRPRRGAQCHFDAVQQSLVQLTQRVARRLRIDTR